jgi:catechol 2,3-dioxygenase-like lactoylglutathione lyase family enzyme
MQKVTGIGGFFFRARDPQGLAVWYRDHLGVDPVPASYDDVPWAQKAGPTVFAPFEEETDYFGARENQFMVNFRVEDLEAMIAQLEGAGIEVRRWGDPAPNGVFAHLSDPEGNQIELWQPA